ncbi:MAG: MBL fold metallo-hydrolase [Firmicutes bacterium]|nr:MBL fold metallo-hydrolase [Bacillota bacterium]
MIIKQFISMFIGTNVYIAVDENTKKAFLVDPADPNPKAAQFLQENGYELEYIILTHGHGDHIGGIAFMKEQFPQVKLVACEKEKVILSDPKINFSRDICGQPITVDADIYVNDGDTLQVGDLELKFIHTPGHTPGGMCIYVGDTLFSGDTLFARSVGRTDFPLGSMTQLTASIREKLFLLPDDTKVYPGHMGATTIENEKRSNPFV